MKHGDKIQIGKYLCKLCESNSQPNAYYLLEEKQNNNSLIYKQFDIERKNFLKKFNLIDAGDFPYFKKEQIMEIVNYLKSFEKIKIKDLYGI